MRELREILTANNYKENGEPNTSLMALKVKVHDKIENRVKGMTAKKVEVFQRNMNMNLNANGTPEQMANAAKNIHQMTEAEVEMELKRLQSQIKELPAIGGAPHGGRLFVPELENPPSEHKGRDPEVVDITTVNNRGNGQKEEG